jgi:hypothetical protein
MTRGDKTLLGGLLVIASGTLLIAFAAGKFDGVFDATLATGKFSELFSAAFVFFAWALGATVALVIVVGLLVLFSGLLLRAFWAVIYTAGNAWHADRLDAEDGRRSGRRS